VTVKKIIRTAKLPSVVKKPEWSVELLSRSLLFHGNDRVRLIRGAKLCISVNSRCVVTMRLA
jgi:hypothetical protein